MPSFTFSSPEGKQYTVNGPEGATAEQAFGILQQQLGSQPSQGFLSGVTDFAKSMPRGAVSNIAGAASYAAESPVPMPDALLASTADKQAALDKNMGLHVPEGRAGKFGEALGSALGNPLTYAGPGTAALKIGGSALASLGSEGAGQATEGTAYEGPARLGGALIGGAAGAKALGPTQAKAAIPTLEELKAAADKGYNVARNSGLEVSPKGITDFAAAARQDLTNGPKYAFTGGQYGSAPKTLAILDELQSIPAGAKITGGNLDTLRRAIGNIAGETKEFKPTPDAKAAMVLKQRLTDYLENLPQNHVVAGSAEDYVRAIRQANGDYAAASRLGKVTDKIRNAENNAQGGIATSIENQQKGQLRNAFLNNPKQMLGFSNEERAQIQRVNDGSLTSNVLRQLGRGGTGVIPLMTHAAAVVPAAVATGGASVLPQLALAGGLYGAKKASEAMTNKQVEKLLGLLAKRSPLYQSRASALPPPDTLTNKAAVLRGLLGPVLQ